MVKQIPGHALCRRARRNRSGQELHRRKLWPDMSQELGRATDVRVEKLVASIRWPKRWSNHGAAPGATMSAMPGARMRARCHTVNVPRPRIRIATIAM